MMSTWDTFGSYLLYFSCWSLVRNFLNFKTYLSIFEHPVAKNLIKIIHHLFSILHFLKFKVEARRGPAQMKGGVFAKYEIKF